MLYTSILHKLHRVSKIKISQILRKLMRLKKTQEGKNKFKILKLKYKKLQN